MKRILFLLLGIAASVSTLVGQEESLVYKPAQISIITPLGTNGSSSHMVVNKISLNIFAGYHAGVAGVELGGFCNFLKYDVHGVQLAGFTNIIGRDVYGVQGAGFVNLSKGYVQGAQGSGFVNIVADSAKAIQGTGFVNYCGGDFSGIQGSGFANVALGNVEGIQGTGFANVAFEDLKGVQGSGFMNVALGTVDGVQGTGFANLSLHSLKGVQASGFLNVAMDSIEAVQATGFINVALGKVKGAQLSGFANVASDTVDGFQASGFLNTAKVLKGYQLGIFNYCDTVEKGVPIGLISYVRRGGLKNIEVWGGNGLYAGVTGKLGTEKLYTIFTAGTQLPKNNDIYWATGLGLGSQETWKNGMIFGVELVSYSLLTSDLYYKGGNSLVQLRLAFAKPITDKIALFASPNFNIAITDTMLFEEDQVASKLSSFSIYSENVNDYNVKMWPGIQAGIRFINL